MYTTIACKIHLNTETYHTTLTLKEREGFHVVTRSAMKELQSTAMSLVLFDKFKKRALFKIRVDVWRRTHNCPEDRAKRAGLEDVRRPRLAYTDFLCWYAWSQAVTTDRQYYDWLRSRRAVRQ